MRISIGAAVLVACGVGAAFVACSSSDSAGGGGTEAPAVDADVPEGGDEPDVDAAEEAEASVPDAGACDAAPPQAVECTSWDGGAPAPLTSDAVYAVSYVYIDRDRARVRDTSAWKAYGFDLDGKASTPSSTDHCQPVAGANASVVMQDGEGGIDNAFGASIAPMIASFDNPAVPSWADKWNESIRHGAATILLRFPDIAAPPPSDAGAPAADAGAGDGGYAPPPPPDAGTLSDAGTPSTLAMLGYASGALCDEAAAAAEPHVVPVDFASLACGDLAQSLLHAPGGTLVGDRWTSGELPEAWLAIPIKGAMLQVHLRHVRIELFFSADRRQVVSGNLGGIANTDELVKAVKSVRGFINSLACSDLFFSGFEQQIRQASDILDDGTQDPGKACDGISLGLGFDGSLVRLGSISATLAAPDPCGGP